MPWQDDPVTAPAESSGSGWQNDPIVGASDEQGPPQAQRTPLQQFGHEQGLGLRSVVEGVATPLTVPADMLAGVLDYALEKAGVPFRFGSSSQALSGLLTKAGVPNPETENERTMTTIGRSISSVPAMVATGGALAGSAAPVTAGVGETLAANPILQTVSAGTGAAGSEIARRSGAGPVGQIAAGVAGAALPSLAVAGTQALVRGGFRGGEQGRQTVEDNLQTFGRAGTTPTVGQATEGRGARAAESLLSRAPGGAGPMVRRAEDQADEVAANLEAQAQALVGRSTSAEQTGRAIEEGVRGSGGFVERFRTTQKGLYDELDNFIAPDKPVAVGATQQALADLATPIKGAEQTSRQLINPKIAALAESVAADAQGGLIPYSAVKQLRTKIGQELDGGALASDVPVAQWKRLYGALSEDMKVAADTPEAMAAWRRADNYTKAGLNRIEAIESVLNRAGGPEAIFKAATAGTREGATTLRSVMQSLDEEGQKMVTATVMRRLGRAAAGVQGELGDQFSSETFLTNWNGLSTEAKRTLFNRYGDQFRSDMDQVAKFAANLRAGSKVFRNPSGTGQAATQATAIGALAASVLTGQLGTAGVIAGGMGGANLTARLMTNPNFVRWLAQSTKIPAGAATAQVNRLTQMARDTKDTDLAQAAILLQQGQQNGGDEAGRNQQNQ